MKSFILKALLCILITGQSYAITIEDFGWGLEELDSYYANLSFEEALKCGDKATFQSAKFICKETCQNNGGFSMCQSECVDPLIISETVTQEIVNCTPESVTLFSSDGDIRVITKEMFLRYKKNPVRELLHQMDSYRDGISKAIINSSYPGTHTLGWQTPAERKVQARFLRATFEGSNSNEFMQAILTVILDPQLPWFAQAARIRIEREGTYWRLQDVQ